MLLKQLSFIAVFFLLFSSCKTDDASSKMAQLEKAVATQPSTEAIQELISAYSETIKGAPNNTIENAALIGKIADLQLKNNQVSEAVETLKSGIKNYYSTPSTPKYLWSLASVFQDNFKNPSVAKAIRKMYVDVFPTAENAAAATQLEGQDSLTLVDYIDTVGSNMYNEKTHRLDTKVAGNFIEICELYALAKPTDTQSPDYLHKAGETARAIRSFPRAIAIYDRIYAEYPNFEKAPQALFLKAFTYDNDLKDFDKARKFYTEFLSKYPNDDFADDTEFLLGNLGKNDEEIIKSFSEKAKTE